jgi:hypothetical protein
MTEPWMPDDYITARRKYYIALEAGMEVVEITPEKARPEFGSDKHGYFYGRTKK